MLVRYRRYGALSAPTFAGGGARGSGRAAGSAAEVQREGRARLDGAAYVVAQVGRHRARIDDREPPVIELDHLREQLRADAVADAADRVDDDVLLLDLREDAPPHRHDPVAGTGRMGAGLRQGPCR